MKKIKTIISEHKTLVLCGVAIVAIAVVTVITNKSDFIKGAKELMVANMEGRLERDF